MDSAVFDVISGSVGGTCAVMVGQPLDTVKVKIQIFPQLYSGTIDCISRTITSDGVRGLYSGAVPALVAQITENSILFAARGFTQDMVAGIFRVKKVEDLSLFQEAVAGSCASFFSSTALCPTELIKCKLQAAREMTTDVSLKKPTMFSVVREVLVNHGPKGMFQGLVPTWGREMPGYFFFFLGYESSRSLFCKLGPAGRTKTDLSNLETLACGGVAGVCFWTSVFPMDVIKSKIQVQGTQGGVVGVGRQILKDGGIKALYNGLTPALLRTFPATAALFLGYEYTKKLMSRFTACQEPL